MDKNNFQKKWNEVKSKVQKKWNKLTNDDMSEIDGHYDRMISKMQKRHGYSREQAEREFQSWNIEGSGREESDRFGMRSESEREESYGKDSESFGNKESSWNREGERGSMDRGQKHPENKDWNQKHGNMDRNKKPSGNQTPKKHENKDNRDERGGWDEKKRKAG